MQVSKSQLSLKHYTWTTVLGDNPRVTGHPDSDLFSRQEGYEVVDMIQAVVNDMGLTTHADIHKLEQLISDSLPSDVRGRENVKEWLIAKMKYHQKFRTLLTDA